MCFIDDEQLDASKERLQVRDQEVVICQPLGRNGGDIHFITLQGALYSVARLM
ncbi:hypothetical protein [Azospirillum endophyticum]